MSRVLAVGLVIVSFVLVGCSPSDDPDEAADDPSGSSSGPSDPRTDRPDGRFPPCEQIWQVGNTLPDSYVACYNAEGLPIYPQEIDCNDGSHVSIHQADPDLFAIAGRPIVSMTFDEYMTFLAETCNG